MTKPNRTPLSNRTPTQLFNESDYLNDYNDYSDYNDDIETQLDYMLHSCQRLNELLQHELLSGDAYDY